MSKNKNIFRWVIIIFVGMAVLMNLAGGIGTSCVAFNLENYPAFSGIAGYEWLYQTFVVTTTIVGLVGCWIIVQMGKGRKNSYRNALIMLTIGAVIGGIHMYFSQLLLGKAVPANVKFFANLGALILLLALNLPGLKMHKSYFENGESKDKTIGMGVTAIVTGIAALTMPIWGGPSHTFDGINFVNALGTEITITGIFLLLLGTGLLSNRFLPVRQGEFNQTLTAVKLKNKEAE